MYAKLVDGVLEAPPVEISRNIKLMIEAGYKPVKDYSPAYDFITQDIVFVGYEEFRDYIKVNYEVVDIELTEEELVIEQTDKALSMLEIDLATLLTDEQALEVPHIFPKWDVGVDYTVGQRVLYKEILYKVLQAHTSQVNWTPVEAPSLFAKVLIVDPEVIPDWEQPSATNPYMTGDKVKYDGKTYVSLIDNNIWSPADYPAGWEVVSSLS